MFNLFMLLPATLRRKLRDLAEERSARWVEDSHSVDERYDDA